MQTRHFDRISPLNATLFRPAPEPGLLGVLACFPPAFLAVRCLQPDRQSGLVQRIDHAALGEGFFRAAEVGMPLAERCQPLPQSRSSTMPLARSFAVALKSGLVMMLF